MSNPLFPSIVALGAFDDPYAFIALLCVAALGLSLIRKSYGLSFFIAIGATFAAVHIIKSITKVPRPGDAAIDVLGYRFPSMHAAMAGAVIASLAWHLLLRIDRLYIRILIIFASLVLIGFAGWTRLYLGVHEFIDVAMGALLGTSLGIIVHALVRRLGLE